MTAAEPDVVAGGFHLSDRSTAEIDEQESYLVPLTESVRRLLDAVIRTGAGPAEAVAARATIDAITAGLNESAPPGPAGVHYNTEGRSWQWGNAAVGPRNAVAPPLRVRTDPDGVTRGEADLGVAYEGPPNHVHGGVLALLVDHVLGVTASSGRRPTMTGTLTLRYRRPTKLGPVRLEGRIVRQEGVKMFVAAEVLDDEGVTVAAEGIWIVPRWARSRTSSGSERP